MLLHTSNNTLIHSFYSDTCILFKENKFYDYPNTVFKNPQFIHSFKNMSNPVILQRFTSEKHFKILTNIECLKCYKNIVIIIKESNLTRNINAYMSSSFMNRNKSPGISCCSTKHVGKCLHHLKIAFCCKYLTVCGLLVKAIVSRWVCINFQLCSLVKPLHMMPVRRCLFSQHTDACSHHIHCGDVQIVTAIHRLDTFWNIQLSDWPIHVLACSNPIDGRKMMFKIWFDIFSEHVIW